MPEPLRVVAFGAESTGKTALSAALARRFGEPWSPEFVRGFWEERAGRITAEDLDAIARGQVAAEERAAAAARRVVFFDTDLLTCTLWNDLLFPGACPAWVRSEAEVRARRCPLFLLCDADVPFTPDPQRCFPEADVRARTSARWRDALFSRGLPTIVIRGAWNEREAAALDAVASLLARSG